MYNAERYLKQCVESVIGQTYSNFELLLIDDASEDQTLKIAQKYMETDKRISVISKEHGGLPHTRNVGLSVAKGDYIVLLDADDYFSTTHLQKLESVLAKNSCDMCIANNHINFAGNTYTKIQLFPYNEMLNKMELKDCIDLIFDTKNRLPAAAVLSVYSRRFLEDNNIRYGEQYKCSEDLDMFMQCISKAKSIKFFDHEFYYYRQDNMQAMTKNISGEMLFSTMSIYVKWYKYYKNNKSDRYDTEIICRLIKKNMRQGMKVVYTLSADNRKNVKSLLKENFEIWGKINFCLDYYIIARIEDYVKLAAGKLKIDV